MKDRYIECTGRLFLREIKKHWWSRWKIDRIGTMPKLYHIYWIDDREIHEMYI